MMERGEELPSSRVLEKLYSSAHISHLTFDTAYWVELARREKADSSMTQPPMTLTQSDIAVLTEIKQHCATLASLIEIVEGKREIGEIERLVWDGAKRRNQDPVKYRNDVQILANELGLTPLQVLQAVNLVETNPVVEMAERAGVCPEKLFTIAEIVYRQSGETDASD